MKWKSVAALSLLTASLVSAKHQIAVLDIEGVGISAEESKILTSKLRSELIKTEEFKVLERGEMENILKEQGFQQTGCTSSSCAVEVGQLLGMSHMVTGSVGKIGELFYIEAKLVSVQTSEIEKSVDLSVGESIETVLTEAVPEIAWKLAGIEQKSKSSADKNKPGALHISVQPKTSQLFLNDSLLGIGDKEIDRLAPGQYRILGVNGKTISERTVTINPGSTLKEEFNLKSNDVYIEVEPDLAKLFIDGKYYGRGDRDLGSFPSGAHQVMLKKFRSSHSIGITVKEGISQTIEVEMPK